MSVRAHKAARLDEIAEQVRSLTESPLYHYRRQNGYLPVVGEGDPDARILFVGEAPGEREAEAGRPFVGAAGRVLDELLASVGLARDQVYITNVVKDRPPGNRDPHRREIEVYAPFLRQQLDIIRPEVIVPLGRFALDFILVHLDRPEKGQTIGELHGQTLEATVPYGKVTIVPLYHPASAFYNRDLFERLRADFRALAGLGRAARPLGESNYE